MKYDSVSGKPMWRERGADTFHPFKSGVDRTILATQSRDIAGTQATVIDYTATEDIECCVISTLCKGQGDYQAPANEIIFSGANSESASYESLWTATWFMDDTGHKTNARTELLMLKDIKAGTRILCRVLPRNPGNPSGWNITTNWQRGVLVKLA